MRNTKIEWAHHTFNPWIGCEHAGSPGCDNCYAAAMNRRFRWTNKWGPKCVRKVTSDDYWRQPLIWNEAAKKAGRYDRVFCGSLMDICDPKGPPVLSRLECLIEKTPYLNWLLLTKRPQGYDHVMFYLNTPDSMCLGLKNIWLGITAENQFRYDDRIPFLMNQPAAIRFVSMEPFFGPIDLGYWHPDWVIVGGETGPGAHDSRVANSNYWIEFKYSVMKIQRQCETKGIPFFFKQWGGSNPKTAHEREFFGRIYNEVPEPRR